MHSVQRVLLFRISAGHFTVVMRVWASKALNASVSIETQAGRSDGERASYSAVQAHPCPDCLLARSGQSMMEPPNKTGLTGREQQVIELIQQGLTNAEIGARLGLSPWTVKRHVARVLAKTGCRRRVDLAVHYQSTTESPPFFGEDKERGLQ